LRGLVAELGERGLKVDYGSVWEFVHAEKLSFKKSERDRPDVAGRRAQWTKYQDRVEPGNVKSPALIRCDNHTACSPEIAFGL
jgi:hypothetical protein